MKSTDMGRVVAPEHRLKGDKYLLDEYNVVGERAKDGNSQANHFIENTKVRNVGQEWDGALCNILHGHALQCEQTPYAFFFTAVMGHVEEAPEMDPTELALKNDGCDGLVITIPGWCEPTYQERNPWPSKS